MAEERAKTTRGKVRKQIVEKAVEHGVDYVKVAADHTCIESLIPQRIPSKEMNFNIFLGKGAVYNPPERTGIYGKRVRIEYGARVNGPIFGRDSVLLHSGGTVDMGSGLVYGSVTSNGTVAVKAPEATARLGDYAEKCLIIVGEVVAENVLIEAPTIVKGNIIADKDIRIKEKTLVYGNVYSKKGSARLENTSLYSVIAGNSLEEESEEEPLETEEGEVTEIEEAPSAFGLEVGTGVSILNPIMWVKDQGKPPAVLKSDVRIISSVCLDCASKFGFEREDAFNYAFMCPIFLQAQCPEYEKLTSEDILDYMNGIVISNAWRTNRERKLEYEKVKEIMTSHFEDRKNEEDYLASFETDELSKYATVEDFSSSITQVTNITQEIISGDKVVGDKTDIRDSVLMKSQVGGRRDVDDESGKKSIEIQDSVVMGSRNLDVEDSVEDGIVIGMDQERKRKKKGK